MTTDLRTAALALACGLALARPAPAQVRLVPFVGTYEPLSSLGEPSAALADAGITAKQGHAVTFGLAAGAHLTGLLGMEIGATLAPSGLSIRAPDPSDPGQDFTLARGGWVMLLDALATVGRPADGVYGAAGLGVQHRWGSAWGGVSGSDLWSLGFTLGAGTAARVADYLPLDLRAELHAYWFDPDGSFDDFGSRLATDLVVRVGVPLSLGGHRTQVAVTVPAAEAAGAAAAGPAAVGLPAAETVAGIATGGDRSCALTEGGAVWCWGGDAGRTAGPARQDGVTAKLVTVGRQHACALTDGTAICWGANRRGQLGMDGPSVREHRIGGIAFAALSAGDEHSCGVAADGRVFCWGANDRGQLGDGTTRRRATPGPIAASGKFTDIAAGGRHTCALRQDGVALCWGSNWSGQVGGGMIQSVTRPAVVAADARFARLGAGREHTCALTAQGAVWCWGANGAGQLGDGSRRERTSAVPVRTAVRFAAVVSGGEHTCGLTADGEAWCWGLGGDGQLGDGAREDRDLPTRVRGGFEFLTLAAGERHTCGLTGDRGVVCWGDNAVGQLGIASTEGSATPVPVPRR